MWIASFLSMNGGWGQLHLLVIEQGALARGVCRVVGGTRQQARLDSDLEEHIIIIVTESAKSSSRYCVASAHSPQRAVSVLRNSRLRGPGHGCILVPWRA